MIGWEKDEKFYVMKKFHQHIEKQEVGLHWICYGQAETSFSNHIFTVLQVSPIKPIDGNGHTVINRFK